MFDSMEYRAERQMCLLSSRQKSVKVVTCAQQIIN